ncbi:MAG: hypothetical protein EOP60_04575 [Sphingomonadales bacterium]|nr:MAG: hypothetical protein EOP60_04575 [Sphingomonadales bacterium]
MYIAILVASTFIQISGAPLTTAVNSICLPYTAADGKLETSEAAVRAAGFTYSGSGANTRDYGNGEVSLSIGTYDGKRYCYLQVPRDASAQLTPLLQSAAKARGLTLDPDYDLGKRWKGAAGQISFSVEDDDGAFTSVSFKGG